MSTLSCPGTVEGILNADDSNQTTAAPAVPAAKETKTPANAQNRDTIKIPPLEDPKDNVVDTPATNDTTKTYPQTAPAIAEKEVGILDLPLEIRQFVYDEVVVLPEWQIQTISRFHSPRQRLLAASARANKPLLLVNEQIFHEVRTFIFTNTPIRLYIYSTMLYRNSARATRASIQPWADGIPFTRVLACRRVQIQVDLSYKYLILCIPYWIEAFVKVKSHMLSVRTTHLSIHLKKASNMLRGRWCFTQTAVLGIMRHFAKLRRLGFLEVRISRDHVDDGTGQGPSLEPEFLTILGAASLPSIDVDNAFQLGALLPAIPVATDATATPDTSAPDEDGSG